jgi:hypothetical protein
MRTGGNPAYFRRRKSLGRKAAAPICVDEQRGEAALPAEGGAG